MPTSPKPATTNQEFPDAFSLFKPSWAAFRLNLDTFVMQLLFPFGFMLLATLLLRLAADNSSVATDIAAITASVLAVASFIVVSPMLLLTQLYSVREKRVAFDHVFKESLHYIPRLLGLFILCALIIALGFVLLIVPGIFAIQRLLLAPYYLIDKNMGIIASIRKSFTTGKKYSGAVWGVAGVLIAINLTGILPYIGWAVSAVLSIAYLCAPAIRYVEIHTKKS